VDEVDLVDIANAGAIFDFAFSGGQLYGVSDSNLYTIEVDDEGNYSATLVEGVTPSEGTFTGISATVDGSVILTTTKESVVSIYDPNPAGENYVNLYDANSNSAIIDGAGNSKEYVGNLSDNVTDVDSEFTFVTVTGANSSGGPGEIIYGEYGYLTFESDGSYRSVLTDFDVPDEISADNFTYVVQDTEGAQDTAQLAIQIVPGEIIEGDDGIDILTGTDKADVLFGYGEDDELTGGQGGDHLYGGAGADNFIWNTEDLDGSRDTIKDFSIEEGDKIDISDLLAGLSESEVDSYIGSLSLTESANGMDSELVIGQGGENVTIVFEGFVDTTATELANYLFQQNGIVTD
jgi:Ca2+-binding RTX toxin-like protein